MNVIPSSVGAWLSESSTPLRFCRRTQSSAFTAIGPAGRVTIRLVFGETWRYDATCGRGRCIICGLSSIADAPSASARPLQMAGIEPRRERGRGPGSGSGSGSGHGPSSVHSSDIEIYDRMNVWLVPINLSCPFIFNQSINQSPPESCVLLILHSSILS